MSELVTLHETIFHNILEPKHGKKTFLDLMCLFHSHNVTRGAIVVFSFSVIIKVSARDA